ncbi:YvaD family protein [Paenibacillus sp. CC-CFT742]|nr:DUF5360 family protein [Paenibacillus sp. CC-CFT742]WJH31988.1 YvaD family protein [Paenibacillus sp. CC-CFT742]
MAFWSFRGEFDWGCWVPNLYLMIYPLFYIPRLLRKEQPSSAFSKSTIT